VRIPDSAAYCADEKYRESGADQPAKIHMGPMMTSSYDDIMTGTAVHTIR
jgi:hypothetical protein